MEVVFRKRLRRGEWGRIYKESIPCSLKTWWRFDCDADGELSVSYLRNLGHLGRKKRALLPLRLMLEKKLTNSNAPKVGLNLGQVN